MPSQRIIAHLFLLACLGLLKPLHAYELSMSSGVNYFNGDYGYTIDTNIFYIPLTIKYDNYPWSAKLTMPFLSIKGPGTLVDGSIVVINGDNSKQSNQGLGDIASSLSYNLGKFTPAEIWIDLSTKVKFPTGDQSRGLGTGTYDAGVESSFAKIYGDSTLFGTVGYEFREKSNVYDFINSAYFSAGFQHKLQPTLSAGLLYDYYQRSTKSGDHSEDILIFTNFQLSSRWSLMCYALSGLTQSAADFGTGFSITYELTK